MKIKRGRPQKYSDFQIVMIVVIMLLKRITSFSGIERYLKNNSNLCKLLGLNKVPHRTVISRRCETIHKKLREVIQSLGHWYSDNLFFLQFFSSMDASLFKTCGPLWHKKDKKRGLLPDKLRNVDKEAEWGFSPSKSWIFGYKAHVNVIQDIERTLSPFPIDAVVNTANHSDFTKAKTLVSHLPQNMLLQLADNDYNADKLFNTVLQKNKLLITPIKKNKKMDSITFIRSFYYEIIKNSKLSFARSTTIEPFFDKIKSNFHIYPLPDKGIKKARIFILGSILCYQLLVI